MLGAGIMGSATALHLARLGVPVTLFDVADAPFTGASRWNEGKIHLGFLYAADPTLETARAVLPGGLEFKHQVESLTAARLDPITTPIDDVYVIHRDSVVAPDAAARYFAAVVELVRAHPRADRYLADASHSTVERLSPAELAQIADASIVLGGFRVPERSVDTNHVANAFVAALEGEPLVELRLRCLVTGVTGKRPWFVETERGRDGPFDAVVNALWQDRPRVDRTVGLTPDTAPHHRYRVSLFVRTASAVTTPSAVIAAGAFGDVKSYSDHDFYLSWYSTGLLARADGIDPPPLPGLGDGEKQRITTEVFDALGNILPWVRDIAAAAGEVRVEGGWVYSQGGGSLSDPVAAVHRRSRLGIAQLGSYFSVDTGKYSVAPTLAERLARRIAGV